MGNCTFSVSSLYGERLLSFSQQTDRIEIVLLSVSTVNYTSLMIEARMVRDISNVQIALKSVEK